MLCACGCGQETKLVNGKFNKYIYNHHGKGTNNHNWKGGITEDDDGYELTRSVDHPFVNGIGYVRTHRLVMEKHIGRYLRPDEEIHHINGLKKDNRIENLQIVSRSEHLSITMTLDMSKRFCSICGSKETYVSPSGYVQWYDDGNNGHICRKCFDKKRIRIRKKEKSLWDVLFE